MDILCYSVDISVADPDFQIRGARSFRPCDSGGGSKKNFRPFGAQFGLKIRGGGGALLGQKFRGPPPPPPPGACLRFATAFNPIYQTNVCKTLKCFFCDKAILNDSQRDPSQLGPHFAYGSSWENARSHSRWRWSSRWVTVWITIWSYVY